MTWPNAANPSTPDRPSVLPAAVRAANDERLVAAVESLASAARTNGEHLEKLVEVVGRFVELVERIAEREAKERAP